MILNTLKLAALAAFASVAFMATPATAQIITTTTPTTGCSNNPCGESSDIFAGVATNGISRSATVGGALVNGQIVNAPGIDFSGTAETGGTQNSSVDVRYNGPVCGPFCGFATVDARAQVSQWATSRGVATGSTPGQTVASMSGAQTVGSGAVNFGYREGTDPTP